MDDRSQGYAVPSYYSVKKKVAVQWELVDAICQEHSTQLRLYLPSNVL